MKRTLLNTILIVISFWSHGQPYGTFMVPVSIEDRFRESAKIVEDVILMAITQ